MKKLYSAIILMAILAVVTSFFPKEVKATTSSYRQNPYAYKTLSNTSDEILPYEDYLQAYTQAFPNKEVVINAWDLEGHNVTVNEDEDNVKLSDLKIVEHDGQKGLFTPERGTVNWSFEVEEEGYYHIVLKYYPTTEQGKSSSIERSLQIKNKIPFVGADTFVFYRVWGNRDNEIARDVNDNDIKPKQVEKPAWQEVYLVDDMGYISDPYLFYFEKGTNTISFQAIKEPLVIDTIKLVPKLDIIDYNEYKTVVAGKENKAPEKTQIRIEAENAVYKSSPTLYPISDRASMLTEPYDASKIRLNTIGGTNWKIPGDKITWEFDVDHAGYYNISMRAKQNQVRGMYSSRKVYIDGEILFEELNDTNFRYNNRWQNVTLGNEDGAFLFYFEPGSHTITMEVTLGKYGTLIQQTEAVIDELGSLYRDIIRFTSVNPDPGRDYQLTRQIPNLLERFEKASAELKFISSEIARISGGKSDKTGVIDSVVVQLDDLIKKHRSIPTRLLQLNNNISSLGNLLILLRELPLTIDYILIHTPDVKLPRANENFFERIWNGIVQFWNSFFNDYSAISKTVGAEERTSIEVWMTMGRDQANVLRQLIDESFTPDTNIGVDLKLVSGDVLLRATLAGIGPDVAINVDSTLPVNYALRKAVYDISQFPDYHDFVGTYLPYEEKQFHPSALEPFTFNGGVYALPEKQTFLMMYVRDDIVADLGLKVPKTWLEIIEIIPDLQANQLQFYLPVNEAGASALNPIFVSMLYQNGGELYINDGKETGLLSKEAMDTFEFWTEFYTLYSFPKSANFINRFRTGEMPMGIAYYEAYNTLSVFAPELRGKWSFHPIPGTERVDEHGNVYIDNTATTIGSGVVMLRQPAEKSEQVRNDSWEFMKWWTSTETQVQFGREMEGILGPAARHNTANKLALEQLAWPAKDQRVLIEQQYNIKSIPQVAGSYIVGREVENAFRRVINDLANARETLYEYSLSINREIDRKRKEFDLPLA